LAFRFCRNGRKGYAIKSLRALLRCCKLMQSVVNYASAGRSKRESRLIEPRLKLSSAISALEEGYSVQVVYDACGAANQIAEEMA